MTLRPLVLGKNMEESLDLWVINALKFCEQSSMAHSGGNLEYQKTNRFLHSGDLAPEVSEGNEDSYQELEAIQVTFQQIIWLYFAHVLRIWVRLNLKIMD